MKLPALSPPGTDWSISLPRKRRRGDVPDQQCPECELVRGPDMVGQPPKVPLKKSTSSPHASLLFKGISVTKHFETIKLNH